jgi:hypothetical protein
MKPELTFTPVGFGATPEGSMNREDPLQWDVCAPNQQLIAQISKLADDLYKVRSFENGKFGEVTGDYNSYEDACDALAA